MKSGLLMAVLGAVIAAGCGGTEPTTTTADLSELRAAEYAVSARRALVDTRFGVLGDEWLVDVVLDGCGRLHPGVDGTAELAALALAAADAVPPSDPVENQILVEVVAAGALDVCPDALAAATTTTITASDPIDAYLRVVGPIADDAGLFVLPDVLVSAGTAVCDTLDAGGDPEAALLSAAEPLFGVSADALGDLEGDGGLEPSDGALLGSVLGAAAVYLCPEHADTVRSQIAGLEATE